MNEIAKILKKEKVYIPSVYAIKKTYKEFWAKKRRANCLKQLHSSKKDNHRKTKHLMVIQHGADNQ